MSRRSWRPRYNTAVRPRPAATRPPSEQPDRVVPGSREFLTEPTPGAGLAIQLAWACPERVLVDLRVAREWVAKWESQPPERRNRAYEAMRDYRDELESQVAACGGEFAYWNHVCNY